MVPAAIALFPHVHLPAFKTATAIINNKPGGGGVYKIFSYIISIIILFYSLQQAFTCF